MSDLSLVEAVKWLAERGRPVSVHGLRKRCRAGQMGRLVEKRVVRTVRQWAIPLAELQAYVENPPKRGRKKGL